ncbi:hypothetical protein P280DRAFT_299473 [Massarina eburnea CBS 473.64]|uniref:40S ribosomal protein S24 n=1 Tax=Massarina eburnea CBS 473.64 TaxID=1395130 RepID=A0A6A6S0H7_9PLEO|nr:hypothetical protein P280DRAFT_299473 [Massarina eburnea CBS 473.64]
MADSQVTLRTRKFIRNPLLGRRQMVVDILHPNRANVSKDELRGKLGELYKAKKDDISVFGLKTHYGGGKTTGFALIYDSAEAMKKFEPHYRLVRYGQASKIEKASRQQRTSPTSTIAMKKRIIEQNYMQGRMLTRAQASNARTGRRHSGAQPRPRAQRRTRNKRVRGNGDGRGGFASLVHVVHVHHGLGVAVGITIVYIYEECLKTLAQVGQDGWAFEIS